MKFHSELLDKNGKLKSWEEQLLDFEYGLLKTSSYLILMKKSKSIDYAGIENQPVRISPSTIQKIKHKHNIGLD